MKLYKYLLASLVAAGSMTGFTSCDNDLDTPPIILPDLGGDGKYDAPLNIYGVTAYYNTYYSEKPDETTTYWATGYIVGCVVTTETVFTATDATSVFIAPFGSATNILLAENPDETDYNNCIALQLPSGAVRTALNLKDNPSNLGKQVTVHGYIDKYLGLPGMRSVDAYNWGDEGIPGVDPIYATFTKSDALEFGKAYAIVAEGNQAATPRGAGDTYGYLYNTTVSVNDNSFKADESLGFVFTDAGDENVYISDANGHFLYMDKGTSGSWFTSFQLSDHIIAGNNAFQWKVSIDANGTATIINAANNYTIAYYSEKTSYGVYSEVKDGYVLPVLYEMDHTPETVPDTTPVEPGTPDTPEPVEGTVYSSLSSTDTELSAGWTIDNITMPSDLSYIWSWKVYNGAGYLNASAFLNNTAYTTEAYVISPVIDLTNVSASTLSFEHAAKFQTTLKNLCGLCVRLEGASDWTQLTIPTWPAAGAWTFVNSGDIDLSIYDGQKIQLAFKYGSSDAGSDTWEIKDLVIKGNK